MPPDYADSVPVPDSSLSDSRPTSSHAGMYRGSGAATLQFARALTEQHPRVLVEVECDVCSGREYRPKHWGSKVLPVRLYAGARMFPRAVRGRFPLVYQECSSCGSGRINPSPNRRFVDNLPRMRWRWATTRKNDGGATWVDDESYVRDKQQSLRTHYERLDLSRFQAARSSVLDVSCGSGVGLELLRNEWSWQQCEGVECDAAAIRAAQARGLEVTQGLIYEANLHHHPYGLVVLDNALEHHWSPSEALRRIHGVLHRDGAVFIIVPNFHGHAVELFGVEYGNLNWGHWHYFTAQSLRVLAKRCGFHIDTIYSSMCEPIVVERLGHVPQHVEVEMDGSKISDLPAHKKIFRGEFLHLLLRKAR